MPRKAKIEFDDLVSFILERQGVTLKQLMTAFQVSAPTIHKMIKGNSKYEIYKEGVVPHVGYYVRVMDDKLEDEISVLMQDEKYSAIIKEIDAEWYQKGPQGNTYEGISGFASWCKSRKIHIRHGIEQWYSRYRKTEDNRIHNTIIDASAKLRNYGADVVDRLYYGDIYALPQFGKTKWGSMIEQVKIVPTQQMAYSIWQHIAPHIQMIIHMHKIDAIVFVPPTVQRKTQIMDFIKHQFGRRLPTIKVIKKPGKTQTQKSQKSTEDRIINAQSSFLPVGFAVTGYDSDINTDEKNAPFSHVLIVDDAVGSAATIVEIGRMILQKGRAKHIYGYAMVGTANGVITDDKGFEIITNV